MTLFALVWVGLVSAAAGLALGALRGRPLQGGPCVGRLFETCQGCAHAEQVRRRATDDGC